MSRSNLNGLAPTPVSALPAAASYANALFSRSTDDTLWYSDGTNWFLVRQAATGKTQITAASAAINTTETYVSIALAIAANQLKAGDKFRIRAYGTCTSTIGNVSTFTPRVGANGSTADTALSTLTATGATTGTTIAFCYEVDIVVRAIGASGSLFACARLTNNGTTGISTAAVVVAVGAAITVNTTGALKIGLSYKSAGATTSATFQDVTVEQVT